MKWIALLLFLLSACGNGDSAGENGSVAQGSLGLNVSVPNFESENSQKKGFLVISHSPETETFIRFERKNYLVDMNKSSPASIKLIQKLYRSQVDVRPYDQNSEGTLYRARFRGQLSEETVALQSLALF